MLNGINLDKLGKYVELITEKPVEAISSYGITAKWLGGVNTEIMTHNQTIGSKEVKKETKKIIYGLSVIIQNGIDNNEIINNIDSASCAGNIYSMIEGAIFLSFTQDNKEYLDNILQHIDTSIINRIKI